MALDKVKNAAARIHEGQDTLTSATETNARVHDKAKEATERITQLQQDGKLSQFSAMHLLRKLEEDKNLDGLDGTTERLDYFLDRKIDEAVRKEEETRKFNEENAERAKEEVSENSEEVKEFHETLKTTLKENSHLIDSRELKDWEKWAESGALKDVQDLDPNNKITRGNLQKVLDDFEGSNSKHPDGLHPRRKLYEKINKRIDKYTFEKPEDHQLIREGGTPERQEVLKNIEFLERELDTSNDDLYTEKAKARIMREMLHCEKPHEQENFVKDFKKFQKEETRQYIELNSPFEVNGVKVKKISDKSKRGILDYYNSLDGKIRQNDYKNSSLIKMREENLKFAEKSVREEVKLFHKLGELYKDDKELFELAAAEFENLDFNDKKNALARHEQDIKNNEAKEKQEIKMLLKAADSKIDNAKDNKHIGKETAKKYKEWYQKDPSLRDKENPREYDKEKLEKAYNSLIDDKPDPKARNLAAYKQQVDNYQTTLRTLRDVNPNITDKELKELLETYQEEGWKDREKLDKALDDRIKEEQKKRLEQNNLEKEAGATEDEAMQNKLDKNLEDIGFQEVKDNCESLIADGNYQEAYIQAAEYNRVLLKKETINPDDPRIKAERIEMNSLLDKINEYIKIFGPQAVSERDQQKIEEETDKVFNDRNNEMSEDLEELAQREILIDATKDYGEVKHQEQKETVIDTKKRAQIENEEEIINKMENDKDKEFARDVTEEFYKQAGEEKGKDKILEGREGEDKKVQNVRVGLGREKDTQEFTLRTKENIKQGKVDIQQDKGLNVQILDKDNKKINLKEATQKLEEERQNILQRLATKVTDTVNKTTIGENKKAKETVIYDFATEVAKKRQEKQKKDYLEREAS